MRGDESRGSGRKPRQVAPPRLPPGALRDFKRHLYRLYLAAGAPSLGEITERIALDDALPGAPSKDTVNRLLTGAKLPGLHDAVAVAAVLAGDDGGQAVGRIRQLWIDAKERPGPSPRTAELWEASRLGVHHAVDVDGEGYGRLTTYIERKHDEPLRERLRHAAEGGQAVLAVLVGQSSTGKTRSAFEAVRRELPDWPLLFPSGARELVDWIATDSVDAGTVVWLNETQRYLTGPAGEDAAEALADLLARVSPLVVIGSMWPEYLRLLTTRGSGPQDEHFRARDLLKAHRAEILVPDRLGGSLQRARKAAVHDRRLRAALAAAGEQARVIQQLTGGPELVRQYDMGPGNALSHIEHAVVTAAVDARRLGHTSALPAELLAEAAAGYLTTTARVTEDRGWFAKAVQSLCSQDTTHLPALVPDRMALGLGVADGFHPADYLDQSVRRARARLAPPAQLWEAAEAHARTADDLYALGQAAQDRRRYRHAVRLYRRAVDRGSQAARSALARLLEETGDRDAAETVAADSAQVWSVLAAAREAAGDAGGARRAVESSLREAAPRAWGAMALVHEDAGERARAEEAAAAAARFGYPQGWLTLARRRERTGDEVGAHAAYERAVAAGEPWGWMGRARLYERTGRDTEAGTAYRKAAAAGVTAAWTGLVHLHRRVDDASGAEEAAARAADQGDAEAWSALIRIHLQRGEGDEAERACLRAAAAGATAALAHLAQIREQRGDHEGAESAAAEAAFLGDAEAWVALARLRQEAARSSAADIAAAAATKAGDTEVWTILARLKEAAGDTGGAERAANEAAENGDAETWAVLSRIRERAGDREGSWRAAELAVAAGSTAVWTALGHVRQQQGDLAGAEAAYTAAAEAGDTSAWAALARLHEGRGDRRRAEWCYWTAVDAGDTEAWEGLLRNSGGDQSTANHGRFGLDAVGGWVESL
ncbi:hypothetical protein ACFU8W_28480 [Streptomyces sp. NPDC057565]|uniref:hypothetical protein n=1 Tax=Streptomyces sp. NPDC057565 TaxID=3346169 RepID=UPI0036C5403E